MLSILPFICLAANSLTESASQDLTSVPTQTGIFDMTNLSLQVIAILISITAALPNILHNNPLQIVSRYEINKNHSKVRIAICNPSKVALSRDTTKMSKVLLKLIIIDTTLARIKTATVVFPNKDNLAYPCLEIHEDYILIEFEQLWSKRGFVIELEFEGEFVNNFELRGDIPGWRTDITYTNGRQTTKYTLSSIRLYLFLLGLSLAATIVSFAVLYTSPAFDLRTSLATISPAIMIPFVIIFCYKIYIQTYMPKKLLQLLKQLK